MFRVLTSKEGVDSIPFSKGVLVTSSEGWILFISKVSVFSVFVKAFRSIFSEVTISAVLKALVSIFVVSCKALISKDGVASASIFVLVKVFKSKLS